MTAAVAPLDPEMALDAALALALRLALSALLVATALHKLRDLARFREAVRAYELVPARAVGVAAAGLAGLELATGLALLAPAAAPALVAAALFALYAGAVAANLARGRRDIACGCGGLAGEWGLHPALVARNAGLAGLSLACSLPPGGRSLVWLDAVTVASVVAVFALLYAATDVAIANAARARAWSSVASRAGAGG